MGQLQDWQSIKIFNRWLLLFCADEDWERIVKQNRKEKQNNFFMQAGFVVWYPKSK